MSKCVFLLIAFHSSVMVLICETELRRSTNCYATFKGESLCVYACTLEHTLSLSSQRGSHPGDTPTELHTSLNKMRKHLQQTNKLYK